MDFDDMPSDREQSPAPRQLHDHFLDDGLEDDVGGDDWKTGRDRSQTPVYDRDQSESKSRPRKRLVKKGAGGSKASDLGLDDFADDDEGFLGGGAGDFAGESSEERRLKRKSGKEGSSGKKEKRHKGEKKHGTKSGIPKKGAIYPGRSSRDHDGEVKEMWETIAGGDSEDDQDGVRTVHDDNFIDDSGVDPAQRYYMDNEPASPSDAPQAEEGEVDDDIKELFKKNEKSPAEIALLVKKIIRKLEVTAEEDAELNRQGKPAINKLNKLSELTDVLSKKELQQEFLDHGVLTLLKNWLEPLPDGSLPDMHIRIEILKILTGYPIDLEQYDRREQLKKSDLGKVTMFLSKHDNEITSNRKLAKDLVDKWSRPIFNKSTRFEDMRNLEDDRISYRRPSVKKLAGKDTGMESRDGDLYADVFSRERRSGQSSSRQHDFVVRPQSKIDPDEIRARTKQATKDQRRVKMNKKLQQLKAPKKKQLQATKLSVEGRGMTKYL
ncbi:protein IWS1 homolog 1-like [Eucalyptus grandis]|uniref:protein IWS1 homolog 1-like n=1 Tax=Eucalyptus grandis TaxID=71139 RepID=UPI00192EA102|nr:protein IWS1 homolog 1-like [Eucalyptus grandis]